MFNKYNYLFIITLKGGEITISRDIEKYFSPNNNTY